MANKVYQHDETAILWQSASYDHAFFITGTPGALGPAAGRQGAVRDFGTAARPRRFVWRARITPTTTCVVGQMVTVYWKTGDGTTYDNNDGTTDLAVTALDKLRNCMILGAIQIDKLNAADVMSASGEVELSSRYGMPIFWNGTANALSGTMTTYGFSLTPVPDEVQ